MSDQIALFVALVAMLGAWAAVKALGGFAWAVRGDRLSWLAHALCVFCVTIALHELLICLTWVVPRLLGSDVLARALLAAFWPLDTVLRTVLPVWAAYALLKAKHLTLLPEERERWYVLEMIYYPRRTKLMKGYRRLLEGRSKG